MIITKKISENLLKCYGMPKNVEINTIVWLLRHQILGFSVNVLSMNGQEQLDFPAVSMVKTA